MREELDRGLAQLGVTHSARQSEELLAYLGMLLETNRRMNLTAIREENTALRLHLLDSATLLAVAPPPQGSSVMDVGTGGGLPGMVLAILRPDCQVTLCDATRKKVDFLSSVIGELGLRNAQAIQGRAEELARTQRQRGHYEYVSARACRGPVSCHERPPGSGGTGARPFGHCRPGRRLPPAVSLSSGGHGVLHHQG